VQPLAACLDWMVHSAPRQQVLWHVWNAQGAGPVLCSLPCACCVWARRKLTLEPYPNPAGKLALPACGLSPPAGALEGMACKC